MSLFGLLQITRATNTAPSAPRLRRFKSLLIQSDERLMTMMRYFERSPLPANLVKRAEKWEYGSAWAWQQKQHAPAAGLASNKNT
tara:strand:+ start:161100 stop:161354 length:255 start_codon:yes stop_codon:yes gene_type:complete